MADHKRRFRVNQPTSGFWRRRIAFGRVPKLSARPEHNDSAPQSNVLPPQAVLGHLNG
jgi:hypothetical protein